MASSFYLSKMARFDYIKDVKLFYVHATCSYMIFTHTTIQSQLKNL